MTNDVRLEQRGAACWIFLHRPHRRNAFTLAMVERIQEQVNRAIDNPEIRALVLTGGRLPEPAPAPAFCAGADLKELAQSEESSPSRDLEPFAKLLLSLERSPKPVIAAVNGAAFGGGLGLIAAADIALAVDSAKFSFSEVRVGLIPAIISVFVVPKIGHQARRLFITGERLSAHQALEIGLIHRVVADSDELDQAVAHQVEQIALGGPEAVAQCKELIREVTGVDRPSALNRAAERLQSRLASPESREGMAAFAQKRRPEWAS